VVGFTADFGLEHPSWLYVAGPGSIVDLGIFSDPPISPVTTHALSGVKTIAIPRQCWLQELSNQPDLAMEMLQRQNERLGLIERLAVMLSDKASSSTRPASRTGVPKLRSDFGTKSLSNG